MKVVGEDGVAILLKNDLVAKMMRRALHSLLWLSSFHSFKRIDDKHYECRLTTAMLGHVCI